MKKILLPVMSLMLVAMGANAQSADFAKKADKTLAKPGFQTEQLTTGAASKAPKKELAENQEYLGINGSDTPTNAFGFPTVSDASLVAAALTDIGTNYEGYKLVGMRFAVAQPIGDGQTLFTQIHKTGATSMTEGSMATITSDNYKPCEISGTSLNLIWNTIMFDNPYTVTAEDDGVLYGYSYVQGTDKDAATSYPVLVGTSTSTDYDNMWVMYGSFSTAYGAGMYTISDEQYPYTPCMQLIAEAPDGSTAVIGIDGSETPVTTLNGYSLDGKQLSTPQKGLNIMKMSDGTTRKVIVNK